MKASELRIGNWILTSTPGGYKGLMIPQLQVEVQGLTLFGQVIVCHTPQIEGFSMPAKHTMGIPLTEEWLIKFGFRMDVWRRYGNGQDWQPEYPRTDYRDFKRDDLVIRIETMSYISKEDKPGELVKHESKSIMVDDNHLPFRSFPEYVHQLQNLYFALTGEELTIK